METPVERGPRGGPRLAHEAAVAAGAGALASGGASVSVGAELHARDRVQAVLAVVIETRGLELQLVTVRHVNEGTPAKRPLEARAEPAAETPTTE